MMHKRRIRDNVWYIVSRDSTDPNNHEAWQVNIEGGKFDGIIGKYMDIRVEDNGRSIFYRFMTRFMPKKFDDEDPQLQFDELMEDILVDWLRFAHQQGYMKYSARNGKMQDDATFTIPVMGYDPNAFRPGKEFDF